MMITRSTKINLGISIVLFLAGVVLVVAGIIYLQQLGAEYTEQVEAVAGQTDREQKYLELSRLVEATADERTQLQGYLLTRLEAPNFITSGEQIAIQQGVEYETELIKEIENPNGYDQLDITFSMEGVEEDVRHMLKVFETLPYHSEVKRVEVEREEVNETGTIKMKVELLVTLADV